MASCAYCNSTIFFSRKKIGDLVFCNDSCRTRGALTIAGNQLPQDIVQTHVENIYRGNCPECNGTGPIDVHTSYRVHSVIAFTSWVSRPRISCKPCGTKRKVIDTLYSAAFGWWGLPWGVLLTPLQIGRNVVGFMQNPHPTGPSPALEKMIRLRIAALMMNEQRQNAQQ